ncbi:U4/U6.U5 tri-snRNP-associated protein 1 [Fukomys damarensis]|uniref:U4/U6.U5 tri-snRNP-associated protein 1 n=1 Tax=Fukomys damarensis TaxID=885580 RepID=A0A091CME5_FUKDA|nr:U4/U6.U5 tri-snRNP-associated protein 1 [Fukomys damarensis]
MFNLNEKQQQDFSTFSKALLPCQNKGLLVATVQKVPNKSLPSAMYNIKDMMAIEDKYSEEYPPASPKTSRSLNTPCKTEYMDRWARNSHPRWLSGSNPPLLRKGSGKTEQDELDGGWRMNLSDVPLSTVVLLQDKQKAQKITHIMLSRSGKSVNMNTITK